MKLEPISPMFFNSAVTVEEEVFQAEAWKEAQRKSERRSRKLIRETFYPVTTADWPGRITEEMIERAREYPIENLVEANKSGMAICLFHEDTRPSMSIKKFNRARCFTCGKKADVIEIYQKINGASFKDAVRALCS